MERRREVEKLKQQRKETHPSAALQRRDDCECKGPKRKRDEAERRGEREKQSMGSGPGLGPGPGDVERDQTVPSSA